MRWTTTDVTQQRVVHAPDGSEIRELGRVTGGSLAHCRLPAGAVTVAVRHRTVEEVWYFVAGEGEVWRCDASGEELIEVRSGVALTIPSGVTFQFRASTDAALEFVLTTMPPWPGPDEAEPSTGPWTPTLTPAH
jgi:mannose-6-phosphate isomerase-like protein (cupin superfamily)